jgi:hypothetical protein
MGPGAPLPICIRLTGFPLSIAVLSDVFQPVLARAQLALVAALTTALVGTAAGQARASTLFGAAEVDNGRFVLVAAPIGNGDRSQLNIYEQIKDRQPCFAVGEGRPAAVNPLLSTFDFTGICGRYLDANGYSVRIGGSDLGTVYRLMVSRASDDTLLLAVPTKAGAGPEMVVARTGGPGGGFLRLQLEPGWKLMRRQYGTRTLGHIYLYREVWPGSGGSASALGGAAEAPATAPFAAPPTPLEPLEPLPEAQSESEAVEP